MVDIKRLIESMKLCMGAERDCHKCMYFETENDCRDSMIYDAVELVKEKEPKSAIIEGSDVAHVGRCPSCHVILTPFRANYCYCCGEAVKWG